MGFHPEHPASHSFEQEAYLNQPVLALFVVGSLYVPSALGTKPLPPLSHKLGFLASEGVEDVGQFILEGKLYPVTKVEERSHFKQPRNRTQLACGALFSLGGCLGTPCPK